MRRIGCKLPAWGCARAEDGILLDLRRCALDEVRRRVVAATRRAVLAKVRVLENTAGDLQGGVWLEPLRHSILGRDTLRGGCTRSVAVGGQWPQERIMAACYSPEGRSQACEEEAGTVTHRHLERPALGEKKTHWLSAEVRTALRQGLSGTIFAARRRFPSIRLLETPNVGPEQRRAVGDEGGCGLTGDMFTDRSGAVYPWATVLSRAGWAAVQVVDGRQGAGVQGALAGTQQTVPRAELYATLAALSLAYKPARIFSDHLSHVQSFRKGEGWCTSPLRPHVD